MNECSQELLEAVGSCIRTKRTAAGGGIFVADCYRKWEEPVEFAFDGTEAERYARRLVACYNACAGIDTETLETGPALAEVIRMRKEEYNKLRAEREELEKTNVYFARLLKQAAEEYLSSNGCPPEWWTIPLMHEIKELLGIKTEQEARAALAKVKGLS